MLLEQWLNFPLSDYPYCITLCNMYHRFSRTDISSKKGCQNVKKKKKHLDVDPLIQWLMETGFLFKMWQMTLIYINLALMPNKSDIWLNL